MFVSTAPLDIELADARPVPVPPRFLRARVLARWSGVPVGIVEVSVRDGHVGRAEVLQALQQQHPHALPREAVRRALLTTGIPAALDPAAPLDAAPEPSRPLPKVSVIVCTRDRTTELAACLQSLRRCDPPPAEVIVVDNVPVTDATRELVRERFREFHYVCELRPGLDWARNRGIAEANGDVIAFTDDDVVVDPSWIGALATIFAADGSIGLVTGLIEPLELETEAQAWFEAYGGFGRGCWRRYFQAIAGRPMPWTLVGVGEMGAGANMAVRRQLFDHVGLFDPALDAGTPTGGGGDLDMFFRLLKSGSLCVYDPAAIVRHHHRRTSDALRRQLRAYGCATRCVLEREALNFPEQGATIRRLKRWWWCHWAWRRWIRTWYRPTLLPREFVQTEIEGYWHGRGVYARVRAALVPEETQRPDAFRIRASARRPAAGPGIVCVDVATPLQAVAEGERYEHLQIIVQWKGRPMGMVALASLGQRVSATRLADEIAQSLWPRLLAPGSADEAGALARFRADVATMSGNDAADAETFLPDNVPVTVVVTTCDRPDALRRCLQSLAAMRIRREIQIVVVDNRPAAGAATGVVGEFHGVELVEEPRPGTSYARNAGVVAARHEIIVMTDDDMVVAPDWLERLVAPFARADVMAVTGNVLPARLESEAERYFEMYGGLGRGFMPRLFDTKWFMHWRRRAAPTWKIGGTGNAAFRTRIFSWSGVGGFDETLGPGVPSGVGEDTKMFYDILQAGFAIAYEPAAVTWHHHRVNLPQLQRQLFAYSRGHVAYHLRCWTTHRDARALFRIFVELPVLFAQRAWQRLRGRTVYPWRLLAIELAGTLLGPWSLRASYRNARRLGAGARRGAGKTAHSAVGLPNPELEAVK